MVSKFLAKSYNGGPSGRRIVSLIITLFGTFEQFISCFCNDFLKGIVRYSLWNGALVEYKKGYSIKIYEHYLSIKTLQKQLMNCSQVPKSVRNSCNPTTIRFPIVGL